MQSAKITFEPVGDDLYDVIYPGRLTRVDETLSKSELKQIIEREPYNFSACQSLAGMLIEQGDLENACETLNQGSLMAMEALPGSDEDDQDDEDDIEIAWDNSEGNRSFVGIIAASAANHYMFGDFEVAATLYETSLLLDTEDHLDVTPSMLCSFAAMEEWEAYDWYKINLAPKSLVSQFVVAFADFMRLTGPERDKALAAARGNLAELAVELKLDKHEMDDNFMNDIESKRPSRAAQARSVWFTHTSIWVSFPDFVSAITQ